MYFCGVDVGSLASKALVVKEGGEISGYSLNRTGGNSRKAASAAIQAACEAAGISSKNLKNTIATGYSRKQIEEASSVKTEISCHALGISRLIPETRTLIDIGGQDSKTIRLGEEGRVLDFAMNDKCAAGSGRFLEVIASSLDISLEELGALAQSSKAVLSLSSTCTVFAESEVISLVAEGESVEDISRAVCMAIAKRVAALVSRVGAVEPIAMSGGVALNGGVVKALEETLGAKISVPEIPQFVGALGAALFAIKEGGCER